MPFPIEKLNPKYKFPDDVVVANPDVIEPRQYAFRIEGQGGGHFHPEPVLDGQGNPILIPVLGPTNEQRKDKSGKPLVKIQTKDVIYGPRRPDGDIVHTNQELDKLMNRPRQPERFVRLGTDLNPDTEALSAERIRSNKLAEKRRKLLARMNVQELREYAEDEKIDLKGASKKDDMLRIIDAREADLLPV